MEKAKPEECNDARLQIIKEGYQKAFEFINMGLTEDEAGHKAEALALYRQGQQHLLMAISIPSQGPECTGPMWESAKQMQQKMQETLSNITTRLRILEPGEATPTPGISMGVGPAAGYCGQLYPQLPLKEKTDRPPAPKVLFPEGQPPGAVGGAPFGAQAAYPSLSPTRQGVPGELPPAYSPQAADGHLSISYGTDSGELSLVGDDFYSQTPSHPPPLQSMGEDGEELLFIQQGVQIFFVSPEGHVSAPSYPGHLRIVNLEMLSLSSKNGFQVCDWLYPLMSTESPVLLCNTGVYMFPDMMAQVPGSYVGVVLSAELPMSERELFQDLMSQLTDLRVQAPEEAAETINLPQKVPIIPPEVDVEEMEKALPDWSEKVAHGILTGASWLSWGLVKGAEYTGKAIHKGASKLREHINPEDKPAQVSPSVAKGLHVAKQATGGAVKVSQFLVDGVCAVASCVGKELAPHVKKHGSKLIPESLKKDKDGRSNIDGAMVVAASGVQGFATVWTGLEVAAKNIAKNVTSETVHTIKHKYGAAAGQATDNAMNSAINVGVTAFNIDNLGIKAVVKKTGKETAHALLDNYKIQEKEEKKEGK
ncbi:SPART protein, partial [Amia calva]|nr:SPART protein [Amia calva]